MAKNIDEISTSYEENGVLVVKELDKEILTRGAWTTIMFKYQDWDWKAEDYGPVRFIIRRYRKIGGEFKPQSKFKISSVKQAKQVVSALERWIAEEEG